MVIAVLVKNENSKLQQKKGWSSLELIVGLVRDIYNDHADNYGDYFF